MPARVPAKPAAASPAPDCLLQLLPAMAVGAVALLSLLWMGMGLT